MVFANKETSDPCIMLCMVFYKNTKILVSVLHKWEEFTNFTNKEIPIHMSILHINIHILQLML